LPHGVGAADAVAVEPWLGLPRNDDRTSAARTWESDAAAAWGCACRAAPADDVRPATSGSARATRTQRRISF
jgi:hypothetical protein